MITLNKEELLDIRGGGLGILVGIAGAIVFLIGLVDGYIRPLKCNK